MQVILISALICQDIRVEGVFTKMTFGGEHCRMCRSKQWKKRKARGFSISAMKQRCERRECGSLWYLDRVAVDESRKMNWGYYKRPFKLCFMGFGLF